MSEPNVQHQIDAINTKLDLLLEYMHEQRLKAGVMDDLMSDLAIVGKDLYHTTVEELDTHSVELDPEEVKLLVVKLLKNVGNFHHLLSLFESVNDLARDAQPIVNEVIIDFTKKLNELDQKGYFEFLSEASRIIENIVTHFSPDDVRLLADNITVILDTVKELTQPDMLKALNNAVNVFKNLETQGAPEYSIWKVMRELNTPEMKRGMGLMVTFMKNMAQPTISAST